MERLKVVTLNIHKGLSHFNRRMVIHDLREGLQSLNPDVVFLQEVQGLNQRFAMRFAGAPVEPQHAFLAGDRWQHVYGCNEVYDHGHHGNAILSRFGFLSFENEDVSDHRYERRGCRTAWSRCPDGGATSTACACTSRSTRPAATGSSRRSPGGSRSSPRATCRSSWRATSTTGAIAPRRSSSGAWA